MRDRVALSDLSVLNDSKYNIFYDGSLHINQSGFDALKSSGYLGKLQNTRIEQLLNEYYLTVAIVGETEASLNGFIENLEVYGFQDRTFLELLAILRRPNAEAYVETHQDEVLALLNSPTICGANFRGTLVSGMLAMYAKLLETGDAIREEIARILGT